MDVMFYEAFKEEEEALKRFLPDGIQAGFTWKTIQEQNEKTPPAGLISIRTQSRIPLDWGKSIKGILTRSQGVDHLIAFRRESGSAIAYGHLDNYCARAVAEQAILMMMALWRKFTKQLNHFNAFTRDGLTGRECRGREVLVAGVGHIGSEIVNMAQGLQMTVKGFDIERKIKGLRYVSLSEGIAVADVVFCALPLTKETNELLNYDIFKKASPGLIFINISRGEIAPAEDLKKLLEEGILGGIGLDVYPQESVLADCLRSTQGKHKMSESAAVKAVLQMAQRDQVLFTPHNAFNTTEALEQKASLSAAAIVCQLKTGTFPHPVASA